MSGAPQGDPGAEPPPSRPGRVTGENDAPAARLRLFVVDRLGTRRIRVEPAGPEGEIALLRVPDAALDRLLAPGVREAIVERARGEGFRYAALDLALPTSPPRPEDPGRSGLA